LRGSQNAQPTYALAETIDAAADHKGDRHFPSL
jgi:hypothetical protein